MLTSNDSRTQALRSRLPVIVLCLVCSAFVAVLLATLGYERTWSLWNIQYLQPHFMDLRVVTAGADSVRAGLDPLFQNPTHPMDQPLNYPRLWQKLSYLGLSQSHTTALGLFVVAAFLVGLCAVLPAVGTGPLLLVGAGLLSPAVLLGIERGNIDLVMFSLVCLAVVMVASLRFRGLAWLPILLAAMLKLYPVFAGIVLVRSRGTILLRSLLALSLSFLVYLYFNLDDLKKISEVTPRSHNLSYGVNVVWMKVQEHAPSATLIARTLAMGLVAAVILVALLNRRRLAIVPDAGAATIHFEAFRAGAAIYLGSFLLGNNWDYRLMFLLLTLPQLWYWSRSKNFDSACPPWLCTALWVSVLISMWHLVLKALLMSVPAGNGIAFLIDESCNWLLFAGLAWLLSLTLPLNWRRAMARQPLAQEGAKPGFGA